MHDIYLVSHTKDGSKWEPDEIHPHTPAPRVRQLLGGRWDSKKEYTPVDAKAPMTAYFAGNRKALVMKFPTGTTIEQAHEALKRINAEREDLS